MNRSAIVMVINDGYCLTQGYRLLTPVAIAPDNNHHYNTLSSYHHYN